MISIYDAAGKVVNLQNISLSEGSNKIQLDFSILSEGIYFIGFGNSRSTITVTKR
jgi:hypothetical protein